MLLQKIQERIQVLSNEAHKMHSDKKLLEKKLADIEVRTHQVVGALHELQMLQVSALKEQEAAAAAVKVSQREEATRKDDLAEIEMTDLSEIEGQTEIVDTVISDDLQS